MINIGRSQLAFGDSGVFLLFPLHTYFLKDKCMPSRRERTVVQQNRLLVAEFMSAISSSGVFAIFEHAENPTRRISDAICRAEDL